MRAVWLLAISNLSARRGRSALLVAAVALSAALIAAVSCALASAHTAVNAQITQQVGDADARLSASRSGADFPASTLDLVRQWPQVRSIRAELTSTVSLAIRKDGLESPADGQAPADASWNRASKILRATVFVHGVWFSEGDIRLTLIDGRMPQERGEIVLDALSAERLSWLGAGSGVFSANRKTLSGQADHLNLPVPSVPALATADEAASINAAIGVRPGDTIEVVRLFRPVVPLKVVGIAAAPPMGGRPQAWFSLPDLAALSGGGDRLSVIEIVLDEGVDAEAFVARHAAELGDAYLLQTTSKVRSGVEKNVASSQLAFALATVMCFLSAAFIIMTGLNAALAEQQRSLAVLRCIGATPAHLGGVQLFIGLFVGTAGAIIGVPLGVAAAWVLVTIFRDTVQTGLSISPATLSAAGLGAMVSGVLGALWPAMMASRLSPLSALSHRARAIGRAPLAAAGAAGVALLLMQVAIVTLTRDAQVMFWLYAAFGLPAMFVGYFLLGVPMVLLVARLLSPLLSRVLRLPPTLLGRTVRATPFRYGLTAGAMMAGLALMIGIHTNASGFLRDWIERIRFPDAFVSGVMLTPESQARLDALPFITDTCAISLVPVATEAFGVRALQSYKTTFVAFEPEPFFRMTQLEWVEGDPEAAQRRLAEGGAVIVAREFRVAQGLGVGDTFTCSLNDETFDFEIVGVVTSPGLELISKFFNVGDEYVDQTLHAVFGSRRDMVDRFKTDSIGLIQMSFAPGVDDEAALGTIREELFAAGVIDAGSGRQIRAAMVEIVHNAITVFSVVAGLSMFIACFGVASVIAAGVQARRFEFGVLRAVGAGRGVLARLVAAEAIIIALAAWVLGTALGLHGAWAGRRLDALLLGIEVDGRLPVLAIAAGLLVTLVFSLGAALPTALRVAAASPRDLLGSRAG
jgi:putative ABC transport system permease protein